MKTHPFCWALSYMYQVLVSEARYCSLEAENHNNTATFTTRGIGHPFFLIIRTRVGGGGRGGGVSPQSPWVSPIGRQYYPSHKTIAKNVFKNLRMVGF